ncbi:MAG: diadenosine tetraphosphate hydrolase [Chloroflexi bacterium]|nr:diadenosine tetraphosphate hydrolase [Chloroflexota bacterium]
MKHDSYQESCSVCRGNAGDGSGLGDVIWEDKLWLVRHAPSPSALAGWTMFNAQRHVQGPAHFNDEEAAAFGPVLRHITRTLEQVTGALRIYVVAFGESTPHMHSHLIPRYSDLPAEHTAFGVADLMRAVSSGNLPGAPEKDAMAVAAKMSDALKASPPPA